MKKHSFMLLTFSAMLSLNAFAPQTFWDNGHTTHRAPSSLEEDRLEELALKKLEEQKNKDKEIVDAKIEAATVQCQKDEHASLEEQMKKLIADKEKLVSELAELAALKKAKMTEEKVEAEVPKKDAVVSKKEKDADIMNILSQFTSFMISQQEQQAKLMNFFFTMMPYMQQQQKPVETKSQYYSPYSFIEGERFGDHYLSSMPRTDYSLVGRDSYKIGLSPRFDNHSEISGPGFRAPSSQWNNNNQLHAERYDLYQRSEYPRAHDGFNFNSSDSLNLTRTQF